MKTVFVSAFLEDAIVVKTMLESAGIPAELLSDQMLDINPFYSIEPKGAKVIVPDDAETDAEAIVANFKEHKKIEK
ncbi:MAG: hypothetical protein ABFC85_09965 [Rectinema sp.]|jgi:hypothetical protein|uniref:DUF2007 domain-containing protein n=1 Tax=uncultured spirochete TaxID=156406 RepID=A0A3P3XMR6_9SPIR|nr:hypothetical protein SPIRO4BDMA_40094 [uncultured spirochete]